MGPGRYLAMVALEADVSSRVEGQTIERLAWAQSNPDSGENFITELDNNYEGKRAPEDFVLSGYGIYPMSKHCV